MHNLFVGVCFIVFLGCFCSILFSQIYRSFQLFVPRLQFWAKKGNYLCLVLCSLVFSSTQKKTLFAMRPQKTSIHAISTWVRRQPPKVKAFLAVVSGMTALVILRFIVHDHDNLFVAAEAVHSLGISVLIYKLMKEKTCAGL